MGLKSFYLAIDKGKHEEAYQISSTLQGEERDEAEIIKALYFLNMGGYDQATTLIKQTFAKSKSNPRLHSLARLGRAWIFFWEAKYVDARLEVEKAEQLLAIIFEDPRTETRLIQALIPFLKAAFFSLIEKDDDRALELYDESLMICSEKGFPLRTFRNVIYNNIAVTYRRRGDWPRAIDYNQKILDFCREMGIEAFQSWPLIQLGVLQHIQGDLDVAYELFQKGLRIARQYQDKRGVSYALENLGLICQNRGKFQAALEYYGQALSLIQSIKLAGGASLSYIYYRFFQLHLAMDAPDQAREYLVKLQEQSQVDQSLDAQIYHQLAQALILKTSQRFKEKAQAQDLLRKVMENKGTSERIRFLAMLHLCDLLLQEVKISGEEALFTEVQDITNHVLEQAQIWKFAPDLINTFIVEAKFLLITGDAHQASKILVEALEIAEDKGLIHLADQVRTEKETLENELEKWLEFADRNASLRERIKFAELEDYLHEAIKIRDHRHEN